MSLPSFRQPATLLGRLKSAGALSALGLAVGAVVMGPLGLLAGAVVGAVVGANVDVWPAKPPRSDTPP